MGLLDGMFGGNAGQQGLLAGSMALLNAGGPSRMPVSLGQALSLAVGVGQDAYQNAQQMALKKRMQDMQLQKMKQEVDAKQAEAEWNEQARKMLDSGDTEGAKRFALGGALQGRPGATALLKHLEDQQVKQDEFTDWQGFKSKVEPAVEAAPAVVVGKPGEDAMATDAANPIARPAVIGRPESRPGGLLSPYAMSNNPVISKFALQSQGLLDSSRVPRPKWLDATQRQLAAMEERFGKQEDTFADRRERDEREARQRQENIRLMASLRQPPAPGTPVQVKDSESKTGWTAVYPNGQRVRDVAPPGSASSRQANADERAITSAFNTAVKPIENAIGSINSYKDVRQLDSAQAANIAADLLRQASKVGNVRFKNEAEKLLGSGYGSGDVYSRMENFLAQEFKGRPSKATLDKLDKLVGALENSTLDNLSEQTKRFAGLARGKGYEEKRVIGMPRIIGKTMILPSGKRFDFPSEELAVKAAQEWEEEN